MDTVWYVGYGSNLAGRGMTQYLTATVTDRRASLDTADTPVSEVLPPNRWLHINHRLYFAGASKTWAGPVAFVDLAADPAAVTVARAFLIDTAALSQIVTRENGSPVNLDQTELADLPVGSHLTLPVTLDSEGYRGKYNALLRLPDIEHAPAFTLTTAHELPRAIPGEAYTAQILRGLTEHLTPVAATKYLAQATKPVLP